MKYMMNKVLLLAISLCYFAVVAEAQSELQKQQYQAFLSGGYKEWAKIVEQQELKINRQDLSDLLNLVDCYYVYTSELINHKESAKAKSVIDKAETLIDDALKKYPSNALLLNYRGTFYSYQVAINKMKGLSLGKKAKEYIDKAYSLEPNNVQVLFDKGNSFYYPPKIFGGDKQSALSYYRKAIRLIEGQKATSQNWKYLQLLFLEAHCLDLLEKYDKAEKVYKKVLRLEPKFKTPATYYAKMLKKKAGN